MAETTENKRTRNWRGATVIFQVLLDAIVGMAIYTLLTTFSTWNESLVLVATLISTATFAEIWEVRIKK